MDAWASTGRKTDNNGEISFRLDHPNIGKPMVWIFRVRETHNVNTPETVPRRGARHLFSG